MKNIFVRRTNKDTFIGEDGKVIPATAFVGRFITGFEELQGGKFFLLQLSNDIVLEDDTSTPYSDLRRCECGPLDNPIDGWFDGWCLSEHPKAIIIEPSGKVTLWPHYMIRFTDIPEPA